jgi:hypothetical protein
MQISLGTPPAGFNYQSLTICARVSLPACTTPSTHRKGRAGGTQLKPLPLEFPTRVDQTPVNLAGGLFLAMRQRPPYDILITICFSPSPRSREALGSVGGGESTGQSGRGRGRGWPSCPLGCPAWSLGVPGRQLCGCHAAPTPTKANIPNHPA